MKYQISRVIHQVIYILLLKMNHQELWQLCLITAFIFICAWVFNKYVEAIMFCVSHTIIRAIFNKQYHCGKTAICLFLTFTIAFFGIMYTLPVEVSLLSAIPICWFISWVGFIAQDRIDCYVLLKELKTKTVWEMDETELANYCYAKGIRGDMLEFVTMVLIEQMKYEEISKKLGYSVDTLKDWSPKCKLKLGIKSWKHE